jgi:hypothetical protein
MRFKKTLFLCGFLFISCSFLLLYERNRYNIVSDKELVVIREQLKTLDPQEKKDLAVFIDRAILFDQYPYVLIGYKPMSICNFSLDLEKLDAACNIPFCEAKKRGYLVWKKYAALFPPKKTTLTDYYSDEIEGIREMSLICLNLCSSKIEEHLTDFCEVLGRACKSTEILEIITNPGHNDFRAIVERDRLLGILLGSGRNNAYLYEQHLPQRRLMLDDPLSSSKDPLTSFTNEWPTWPRKWRLPGFACDPATEETKQLKKHYQEARKIIRWTYFNRDNLEVTLALLVQP